MTTPIIFFDIAGKDDKKLVTFYKEVFDWEFDKNQQCVVPVSHPISGAIRKDPAEKRIYLGVQDINKCLKSVKKYGGSVDTPRFEVPGQVVLALFKDPAGNPMGLVEMDGDGLNVPDKE